MCHFPWATLRPLLSCWSSVLMMFPCIWCCFGCSSRNTSGPPARDAPPDRWVLGTWRRGRFLSSQQWVMTAKGPGCDWLQIWNWCPNRINVRRVHTTPVLWSRGLDCFEEGLDFSSFHYKVIFWSWTLLSSVWKIKPGKLYELSLKKYAPPVESNADV